MLKLATIGTLAVFAVGAAAEAQEPAPATGTVVSAFSVSPSTFRVARKKTHAVIARAPIGTKFSYTVSADAAVKIALEHRLRGRLVDGECVRGQRSLSKKPRCIRFRPMGTLERNAKAGVNTLKFTGRLVRTRPFPPGSYRATIVATAPGLAASEPRSVVFHIVR
jgi:hypothetical protein